MSYTHLEDTQPKARKRYVCELCRDPIEQGTVHIARRGIGEEGPETCRMHIDCEKLTHDWEEEDWMYRDTTEFKRLLTTP